MIKNGPSPKRLKIKQKIIKTKPEKLLNKEVNRMVRSFPNQVIKIRNAQGTIEKKERRKRSIAQHQFQNSKLFKPKRSIFRSFKKKNQV